jgi:hypothetical protein
VPRFKKGLDILLFGGILSSDLLFQSIRQLYTCTLERVGGASIVRTLQDLSCLIRQLHTYALERVAAGGCAIDCADIVSSIRAAPVGPQNTYIPSIEKGNTSELQKYINKSAMEGFEC